jgi:hypothetical protein
MYNAARNIQWYFNADKKIFPRRSLERVEFFVNEQASEKWRKEKT